MRRALAVLITILLFAHELPARSHRDWENVEKLKRGSRVLIFLSNGVDLSGRIDAVSDAGLRLDTSDDRAGFRTGSLSEVDRKTVRRIVLVPRLPDSHRWMIAGTLIGGAAGVTAGGISDARHGNNGRWLGAGFAGAVLGFFASRTALAVVGGVEVFHHDRIIYEYERVRPLRPE